MGMTPAPKGFNRPMPFGSTPEQNSLQQTQPLTKIDTAGMGFANTNQDDKGISTAQAQAPAPTDTGFYGGGGRRSPRDIWTGSQGLPLVQRLGMLRE